MEETDAQIQVLTQTLDSMSVLLWRTNASGAFDFFNQAFVDYTGYRREELAVQGWQRLLAPEDAALNLAAWQDAFVNKSDVTMELKIRRHDGAYRWMLSTGRPIFNSAQKFCGYVGNCVDIHERKIIEEQLAESHSRFESYKAQSRDGIAYFEFEEPIERGLPRNEILDKLGRGHVIEFNPLAAKLLGIADGDALLGKRLQDLFDIDTPEIQALVTEFLDNGYVLRDFEYALKQKSGEQLWLLINAEGALENGRLVGAWESYRDVTEHVNMVKDLQRTQFAVDHVGEAVFLFDRATNISYANHAASAIFGYSSAELCSMRGSDIDMEFSEAGFREHWDKIANESESHTYASAAKRADGGSFPVEITLNVVSTAGKGLACAFVKDITEQVETARMVRLMQFAVERSGDSITIIDGNGRYRYANAAATRVWGYSEEELLQKTVVDLDPGFTPERFQQLIQEIKRCGGSFNYAGTGVRGDGTAFPREVSIGLFEFEGEELYCGIQRDISERMAAEAAVHAAHTRFESLVETSPLAVIEWDMNLLVTRWSAQAEALFEWPADIAIGTKLSELKLIHLDDIATANRELDTLLNKEVRSLVVRDRKNLTRSGRIRRCEWHVSSVSDANGQLTSILGLVNDVTEQQRDSEELATHRTHLEELVEQRSAELEAAQGELVRKEKLSVLGRLTGTVSHELRNPLGTIKSSVYFVKNAVKGQDSSVDRALDRADRNISRCDKIIDELLDYTRVQELRLEAVQIDDWLGDVVNEFGLPENISLRTEFDFGREIEIEPERLRRCIVNVLSNACEAMNDDGIERPGSASELRISSRPRNGVLEIDFEDTGPGIAAEDRTKILEPLFSTKGFGVGLGLPIVAQILDQHSGSLDIVSEPGKGTLVRLSLPLEQ